VTIGTSFALSPSSDDLKAIGVMLPQGLVGDPNAADRCSLSNFNADSCPAASEVGSTTAQATAVVVPGIVEVPQSVPGTVYNLQPKPGEAARLGVVLRPAALNAVPLPKVFLQSPVTVGPQTGYGLATQFDGLPRTSGPFDIRLNSMELKLNAKAAHGPFITNPTDCRKATATASAFSYDEPTTAHTAGSSFTPTDCAKLPFAPHLAGSMGGQGRTAQNAAPEIITAVTVDRGSANPERVQVSLPPNLKVSFSSAVVPCAFNQFDAGTCPAASHLGTATASSPLLPAPLTGPVTFVAQQGGLPALAVQFGPPVPLTLFGATGLGESITNTFDGIPDLPLSRFELTVDGGGRGLIVNSADLCSAGVQRGARAQIVSHSGATANLAADFQVVGCEAANPGSTVTEVGGEGRPRATLGLHFKRRVGTLTGRFRAGTGAPALTRARLAIPKRLKLAKERLRVTAGGKRVKRSSVHLRGHSLDVRLGKHHVRTAALDEDQAGAIAREAPAAQAAAQLRGPPDRRDAAHHAAARDAATRGSVAMIVDITNRSVSYVAARHSDSNGGGVI
jgi:hypothetical protein